MCSYLYQNTLAADYQAAVIQLFHHLIAPGWDKHSLKKSILVADAKLHHQAREQQGDQLPSPEPYTQNNIFLLLHLPYHPFDIPKSRIRQLYNQHCQHTFSTLLGMNNLTIAYSQHKSLKEHLTQAKLHQAKGKEASKYYKTHSVNQL